MKSNSKNFSRRLKLVCLFSAFNDWEEPSQILTLSRLFESRGFEIKAMGEIRQLSTSYVDPETDQVVPVKYYCHLSQDTQILRCFTTAMSDDIESTLDPATEGPGLYHLWMNPRAFRELMNSILGKRGARATYFVASRVSPVSLDAKIRPEGRRTIMYYGDDAQDSLNEYEYQYGVIPNTVRLRVPGIGDLQITARGIFTYFGGDMEFVLETSNRAIDLVLRTKKIIDSSRLEVVSLKTSDKELELFQLTPWRIELERSLDASEFRELFEQLEASKFAVYNSIIMEGSLHAESTILDELKRTIFTFTADSHTISISPRYESSFESFFRFYETIVERFDSGARCTPQAVTPE